MTLNRAFDKLFSGMQKRARLMVEIVTIDGSIDAGDDLYWGMVQYREGQALARVRARRAKPFPGNLYKAALSPDDGMVEIIDADPVTTKYYFNGLPDALAAMSVPNHGWTHRGVNGLDPLWLNIQQVIEGQVRPANPNSLSVVVKALPYVNYAGETLDLTSYLPSSGYECIAVIALNYVTRLIQVTTGGTQVMAGGGFPWQGPGAVTYTASDVEAVTVDHNDVRLAAVRLYAGQTQIKWSDIFLDLREFAGRRTGYLRLDDDDPTLDGLAAKLIAGTGIALSRQVGDSFVISVPGYTGSGWNPDAAPESPSAYDDEFDDASFDTGLWDEYDTGAIETIAEASDLLSLSQASQVIATLTGVYQSIPAGDFTIACKMQVDHASIGNPGYFQAGIVLWDDATDDGAEAVLVGPGVWHDTSDHDGFGYGYFTDRVSLALVNLAGVISASTWYYLRVRRSGSTYYFDWSTDGETWTVQNFTSSMPFTPSHFGLGLYNGSTGFTLQADVEFFRYRAAFDGVGDPVYGRATGGNIILPSGLAVDVPVSPLQGQPYFETDTQVLRIGNGGTAVLVAGLGTVPNPVTETVLVPAGYQTAWHIPPGGTVSITGALQVDGTALFIGGL